MAVLEQIRRRTGLLLIIVFGALFLFIVQGLFSDGTLGFFQDDPNVVAEINGHSITRAELANTINYNQSLAQVQSQGQPINPYQKKQIESQSWEEMVFKYAYQSEFDKLGIKITTGDNCFQCEDVDMVQGENPHPSIVRNFTDPETGVFDASKVKEFISYVYDGANAQNPEVQQRRAMWEAQFDQLKKGVLFQKYTALMTKSTYVTTAEAKKLAEDKVTTSEVKYLQVPYHTIEDSVAGVKDVSDADLKTYLANNSTKYEFKESRIVDYLALQILPNGADSTNALTKVRGYVTELYNSKDDTMFYSSSSATVLEMENKKASDLPYTLRNDTTLAVGKIFGPIDEPSAYKAYKVIAIDNRDTVFKATASHIIIQADTSMDEATLASKLALAESILEEALVDSVDFVTLANQRSEDPKVSQSRGSLGEFESGQMLKEIQDAVFEQNEEGVVNQLVKTRIGYHIIRVDKVKSKADPMVSYIEVGEELVASDETIQDLHYKAQEILDGLSSQNVASLKAYTDGQSDLFLNENNTVSLTDNKIGNVDDTRRVVSWAYENAEEGDLYPEIVRTTKFFVIAGVKAVIEEGVPNLEAVRSAVTNQYKNEKKAEFVASKLSSIEGSLEQKAEKLKAEFGDNAVKIGNSVITGSNVVVTGMGSEPTVAGAAVGLAEGANSDVIKGENGAVLIQVVKKSPVDVSAESIEASKQELLSNAGNAQRGIDQVIKSNSTITDKRYKF